MTPLDQAEQIRLWQQKAADGTLTLDDTRAYIRILRAGRQAAAAASDTARRKRAIAEIPSADELLEGL